MLSKIKNNNYFGIKRPFRILHRSSSKSDTSVFDNSSQGESHSINSYPNTDTATVPTSSSLFSDPQSESAQAAVKSLQATGTGQDQITVLTPVASSKETAQTPKTAATLTLVEEESQIDVSEVAESFAEVLSLPASSLFTGSGLRISRRRVLRELNVCMNERDIELINWLWGDNSPYIEPLERLLGETYNPDNAPTPLECEGTNKVKLILNLMALGDFWKTVVGKIAAIDALAIPLLSPLMHFKTAFVGLIRLAVLNVGDLTHMKDYLFKLGRMHERMFSTTPLLYHVFGDVINITLVEYYQSVFTPELETAWIMLCSFLISCMLADCSLVVIEGDKTLTNVGFGGYSDTMSLSKSLRSRPRTGENHAYNSVLVEKVGYIKKLFY